MALRDVYYFTGIKDDPVDLFKYRWSTVPLSKLSISALQTVGAVLVTRWRHCGLTPPLCRSWMINENITIYNILPLYFVYTRCILNHERNEISTYILNIFQYLYSVIFRTNTRWSFCGTSARRTTWGLAARGTPPPPATSGGGDTEEEGEQPG